MALSRTQSEKPSSSWLVKPFAWLVAAVGFLLRFLLLAWATLALYWSNVPWRWLRLLLAIAFLVLGIYLLWLRRSLRSQLVFAVLFLAVLASYLAIQPSFDRPWQTNVAVMPEVTVDGDRVLLKNVRNFDYRTTDDYTVRYETREVQLSHLISLDFFVSYWIPGPIAHTFVSFNFDNAPPVCISIEARRHKGQGFDPLSSLFKQFGLIYVVGEERDIVRVRTNFRHEDVYLYRIKTTPEKARGLFLIYLERINELATHPEFYHLLSNSCTINIVRYARLVGKIERLDIGFLFNGYSDRALYRAGLLDSSLPFAQLRRRAWINQLAQAADDGPDFPQRIRASLPSESR